MTSLRKANSVEKFPKAKTMKKLRASIARNLYPKIIILARIRIRGSETFISNSACVYYFKDFKDCEKILYPDVVCILKAHYVNFQVKHLHFGIDKIQYSTRILLETIRRDSEVLEER